MANDDKSTRAETIGDPQLESVTGGQVGDGVREFLFPAGTGGLDLAATETPGKTGSDRTETGFLNASDWLWQWGQ